MHAVKTWSIKTHSALSSSPPNPYKSLNLYRSVSVCGVFELQNGKGTTCGRFRHTKGPHLLECSDEQRPSTVGRPIHK